MLQWGRAAVGTESMHICTSRLQYLCFNGAVPLWARKEHETGAQDSQACASMGPCRCGHGKSACMIEVERVIHASMGPCRCGHGKQSLRNQEHSGQSGFNGAVPLWARKAARRRCAPSARTCFNGAVPLWARKGSHRLWPAAWIFASMGPCRCGHGKVKWGAWR